MTCKERKVHVLLEKLHESITHAQNESCLEWIEWIDGEWIEIKIEVAIKFKMAAIGNL